jgi:hypothetical protein
MVILSNHYGKQIVTRADGDLDRNGTVDFADLVILSDSFGAPAAAPAPATRAVAPSANPRPSPMAAKDTISELGERVSDGEAAPSVQHSLEATQ